MQVAHTGRTGKDTSVTFDTDKQNFCRSRRPRHDVYIYAEQTRNVTGVIKGLEKIGYKEVDLNDFEA